MTAITESLTSRSIKAVKWNYLGTLARIVAQVVAQLGMARLLGPQVVGAFGYALLLSGILGLIIDQGLGAALIHDGKADQRSTRIAFWRIMSLAALCSAGTYVFADQLAWLMGGRQAGAVLRGFAPAYMLLGAGFVAQADLRRALRFREIQIAQTVSYILGYVVIGLGLAAAGYGVWSMIIAWLSQTSIATLWMYAYSRHALAPINPLIGIKMAKFGRDILSINFVNWLLDNAMAVYIGKMFGATSLGFFNISMSLVLIPAGHLVVNLQNVVFPTASVARNNPKGMHRLYLTSLSVVALLAIPSFLFVAQMADPIVAVLLGNKWAGIGQILTPLALAMIPHVLSSIAGSVLCGRGDQRLELASQVLMVVLYAACFFSMWNARLEQVCWIFLAVYCTRALVLTFAVTRRLGIPLRTLLETLQGPVVGAAMIGLSVLTARHAALMYLPPLSPLAQLLMGVAVALVSALVFILAMPQWLIPQPLLALAGLLSSKNPRLNALLAWIRRLEARPSVC